MGERRPPDRRNALEALRLWGGTPEQIAEWRALLGEQAAAEQVSVWPEHWHAWQVFRAMSTQWRAVAGHRTVWLGLDYAPLPTVARAVRPTVPRAHRQRWSVVLDQLQVIELAAIKARNTE